MPGAIKFRSQGTPRRELTRRSSRASPVTPLALVHVTAVGTAREIIEAGQLETRLCPSFGRRLAYFFALRPAYKLRDGTTKTDKINYFPFVFVVSPDDLGVPFHVYPFDTGGALAGVFDEKADRTVPLDDYELDPDMSAAGRHIGWAFGDAAGYLRGELRSGLLEDVPVHETVTRGFAGIAGLASTGHNQPDRRASAVEIAFDRHIPLRGNVRLAVLPKQYLEDAISPNDAFIERLRELDIPWATYDWQPNRAPDDFVHEIHGIVIEYYQSIGFL